MRRCERGKILSGKKLIFLGLLGLFFYSFPGILLGAALFSLVIGILFLP